MQVKDIESQVLLPDGNKLVFRPFAQGEPDVVRDIYEYGHYDFLKINEDDVVVDVGAHIGVFTLRVARHVVDGKIIGIEPYPSSFKLLKKNVGHNKYKNVITINKAISDKIGKAKLYLSPTIIAHSTVFFRSLNSIEVETTTLDKLLKDLDLKPDFIKIDAEGAELNVLSGANKTLKQNPAIAIAAYHTPLQPHEITRFLLKRGFEVQIQQVAASPYRAIEAFVPIVYAKKVE